jgi:flagellin-like hook-associated protein FlgL
VDGNTAGTNSVAVTKAPASYAAWDLGLVTSGETNSEPPQVAQPAHAAIQFAAPNHLNSALRIVANTVGPEFNDISIEFRNTLVGDSATVSFDPLASQLIINMADGQTTANTVIAAVAGEGTFRAELDLSSDPTNDGTGTLVAPASVAGVTSGGTWETLGSEDTALIQTEGIFNTLIQLKNAILNEDFGEIERAQAMLDVDFERLNFGRAVVGIRGQGLDAMQIRNEDEQIQIKTVLSEEIEVDLAVAASDFAARQAAYEASLRTTANLYQMTLLDFL